MSLRLETYCNSCGKPACRGLEKPDQLPLTAREYARRIGWVYKDGIDTCPECLKDPNRIVIL